MYNYQVAVFGAVYQADRTDPNGYSPIRETAFPCLEVVGEVYDVDTDKIHRALMRTGFCKVWTLQKELVIVARLDLYELNSSREIH
jgi:hypothetical protein